MPDAMPALMRSKDVCRLLCVSRWSLNRLAAMGVVRTVTLLSQQRYVREDVLKLTDPNREDREVLSPLAAAKKIGSVSSRTISRMAEAGKIRSIKTPGGHCRVYLEDVLRFVKPVQRSEHACPVKAVKRVGADR